MLSLGKVGAAEIDFVTGVDTGFVDFRFAEYAPSKKVSAAPKIPPIRPEAIVVVFLI